MLDTTQDAVKALLRADPSLTPTDRTRILATIREHGKTDTPTAPAPDCILRRVEVARRMGCSLRAVDHWARAGLLQKVTLPGRVRAVGFRESAVCALIAGHSERGAA